MADRKRVIEQSDATPGDREAGIAKLDFVADQIGIWELNRLDTPSLPNRPRFHPKPETGKSFSQIPIPREHRHAFKGHKQRKKRWAGRGCSAWCHYLAQIDDQVAYFANPPEAARIALPKPSATDGLDQLDALRGRSDSDLEWMAAHLFASPIVTSRVSPQQLKAIRNGLDYASGYLKEHHRTRIDCIDLPTLVGYRNLCRDMLRQGVRSLRTINGYLSAFRRVLGWCRDYCEVPLPAFDSLLANFSRKEIADIAKQAGHKAGGKTFARTETVAMPIPALKAWFRAVKDDPFELALSLCSYNLAAGASDLSELRLFDDSLANPMPSVDMNRRLFITYRQKTLRARWTIITDRNEKAIPMLDRTHAALQAWLERRETIIPELRERADIPKRVAKVSKARRLRNQGRSYREIAEALGIVKHQVHTLLEEPANRRDWARSLVQTGYSVKDTAALTGLSVGSVSKYVRDITAGRNIKPRGNRYSIVLPDPNRVFFVPNTGRPLVNRSTNQNYVGNVFNRICDRAGIRREASRNGQQASGLADGFVLPKGNGQYMFRRTAATVAGVLGGVEEPYLQRFLGHSNPESTRKYLLDPPMTYKGERMTYECEWRITPNRNDPIAVIGEFLDLVLADA